MATKSKADAAFAASVAGRLMAGLSVHSRPNGTVHSIHGADGKTAAEVCIGSTGRVRLNFRSADVRKLAPKGITLDGRSNSWQGGGVVVTDANLAAARAFLTAVVGGKAGKPKSERKSSARPTAAERKAAEVERKAEVERIAALAPDAVPTA